jgi:predicted SAM-dependent methyltransferase
VASPSATDAGGRLRHPARGRRGRIILALDGHMSEKREHLARWLTGHGIEIGALHRPLKVPASAHVRYVDRLPETELRKHYPELDGQPLAPVSILGSAEDLSSIQDDSVDFVIANHLLEHLEYPIRGLAEFHRVLRAGGLVYMALPDQRQTFDRYRALTPVEHLLLEHRSSNAERNRRAHYMDWVLHVNGTPPGPQAEAETNRLVEMGYSIHFHVWTPDTFLDFFVAARREANLAFSLLGFSVPEQESDDEFILLLAKGLPERPRLLLQPQSPHQERPMEPTAAQASSLLRFFVLKSPLGPPLRAIRRTGRRFTGKA